MNIVYAAMALNGKRYIGVTTKSLDVRKRSHKHAALVTKTDNKFYRAIRRHGFDSFTWVVLFETDSIEVMFQKEKDLIVEFKTRKHGYNSTDGGEGAPGRIATPRQRQVNSRAQSARFKSKDPRLIVANGMKEFVKLNPELHKANANKRVASLRMPEKRELAAKKQKIFAETNPEIMIARGQQHAKKYKLNPSIAIQISRKLGGRPIEVFSNEKFIAMFQTQAECARILDLSKGNINSVLRGRRESTGGYVIRYADVG